MKVSVRAMAAADRGVWVQMRSALWPEDTPQGHASAFDSLLGKGDAWGFIAETPDGAAVGFAEVAIRACANGCDSQPVPFLEGIWVEAPYRRRGVGGRLIRHVELFVAARGFRELGSDTQIDNRSSQAAHVSWGFAETERVVYFRKRLGRTGRQTAGRRAVSTGRDRSARVESRHRAVRARCGR